MRNSHKRLLFTSDPTILIGTSQYGKFADVLNGSPFMHRVPRTKRLFRPVDEIWKDHETMKRRWNEQRLVFAECSEDAKVEYRYESFAMTILGD